MFILDHGDLFLRFVLYYDHTAFSAFSASYAHWISYFDPPLFTLVDKGSNIAATKTKIKLHEKHYQLCPIPVEAPWSLEWNERSHHCLHKAIDRLINKKMI